MSLGSDSNLSSQAVRPTVKDMPSKSQRGDDDPAEVSAARCPVVHYDHHDPDLRAEDVWGAYADITPRCRVAWSDAQGGFWLVTGFDEVQQAARDHETFSSAEGHLIPMTGSSRSIPIDFDPPLHSAYRGAMLKVVSRDRIRELHGVVREFLAAKLGEIAARGHGELVSEVALPLPLMVLTRLIGLSQETVAELRPMTEEMWERVGTEDLAAARGGIFELMDREIARHLESATGSPIVELAATEIDGRQLHRDELQRMLTTFAVAGHETTLHAVGNLFYDLATNPGVQAQVREDPTVIPAVVEESLRLRAPGHGFGRSVTTATELGGVPIPAGDKVLLNFAAANRDPRRYERPQEFVPGRAERGHLAFGWGIHQCAGAPLARMEMQTLLEVLLELPEFRLDGEAVFSGLEGGHHMGPRRLPVKF